MKNSRKNGSLISFLIKNYIFFTLLVVLSLIVLNTVFLILATQNITKWSADSPDNYIDVLKEGRYNDFPGEKIFGKESNFAVIDSSNNVIYKTSDSFNFNYTADEINIIPFFDKSLSVIMDIYNGNDGTTRFIVSKTNQNDKNITVFDADYNVIFSTENISKEHFSQKEFDLYSMTDINGLVTSKYKFLSENGSEYTMIISSQYQEDISYRRIFKLYAYTAFAFILIYIILIALFVIRINLKIKKPLKILENAILDISKDRYNIQLSYRGPVEFVRIFDKFEKMAECLTLSEQENSALQKEKQSLLADISHDLKTPITVIQGYAKALNDNIVPKEEQGKYLEIICQKSELLTQLINTFSEYNKLEHPTYKIQTENTDIYEFCREYLSGKYEEIEKSGFSLDVDIPEKELIYPIDAFNMQRVFDNIFSNAIKHNPKNTNLFFEIKENESNIVIKISDDGVGIPEDIAENIFTPFSVGSKSRSNNGSGLGLAIAKKIVLLHNGNIVLNTPPKTVHKTEFEITLPKQI